jgi:hypothetical protein
MVAVEPAIAPGTPGLASAPESALASESAARRATPPATSTRIEPSR